jgi:hypothetical protein
VVPRFSARADGRLGLWHAEKGRPTPKYSNHARLAAPDILASPTRAMWSVTRLSLSRLVPTAVGDYEDLYLATRRYGSKSLCRVGEGERGGYELVRI